MEIPEKFGIIAGNGAYPFALARGARSAGVREISVVAFEGETQRELSSLVDDMHWIRVGQLGRMIRYFQQRGVQDCVMAGQIAPRNLFDLRPDFKALLILAKLKERNAETIFRAIGDELRDAGITLHPATLFLEDHLARAGHLYGPRPDKRCTTDVEFGFRIAKEMSRLDVGQTVVVKKGTVLSVEAFEGTNDAMRRGGKLGRGGAIMVKVSKPNQDLRFDVPVIGRQTIITAAESGIRLIAVEAGMTLLLEPEDISQLALTSGVSICGVQNNL